MANITFDTAAGAWSVDADWIGGTKPGAGDTPILNAASGDCTLDENTAALSGLTMTDYTGTLDFSGYTLDSDGAVVIPAGCTVNDTGGGGGIECAGNFTLGVALPSTLTVTLNGMVSVSANVAGNLAHLIIASIVYVAGAPAYWGSFTLQSGLYGDAGFTHTIAGSIQSTGGTMTSTGDWIMTATGNLQADQAGRPNTITVTGGTCTFNGTVYCIDKFDLQAGATLVAAGQTLWIYNCNQNDCIAMNGTITSAPATISFYIIDSVYISYPFEGGIINISSNDNTITINGAVTANTSFNVYNARSSDGNPTTVVLGTSGCSLGAVTIGHASINTHDGVLNLGNGAYAVALDSITVGAGGAQADLDFGNAAITATGAVNLTGITPVLDEVALDKSPSISGGTVSNVAWPSVVPLDCSGGYTYDGGGNTGEIWFGSEVSGNYSEARRERHWGDAAGTRR